MCVLRIAGDGGRMCNVLVEIVTKITKKKKMTSGWLTLALIKKKTQINGLTWSLRFTDPISKGNKIKSDFDASYATSEFLQLVRMQTGGKVPCTPQVECVSEELHQAVVPLKRSPERVSCILKASYFPETSEKSFPLWQLDQPKEIHA